MSFRGYGLLVTIEFQRSMVTWLDATLSFLPSDACQGSEISLNEIVGSRYMGFISGIMTVDYKGRSNSDSFLRGDN